MRVAEIKELLAAQVKAMEEFGVREAELQSTILDRDWPTIETLLQTIQKHGAELEQLDLRREELFLQAKADAGLAADAAFGELLAHVDEVDRRELAALYRSLQASVLRVKSVTRGIDSYVRGTLRTTNEVLGEVFPDQKGTIHSRRGRRSPADGRAMVLDRRL
jgi:hypothetical protein